VRAGGDPFLRLAEADNAPGETLDPGDGRIEQSMITEVFSQDAYRRI
jgi:hypothetical protein